MCGLVQARPTLPPFLVRWHSNLILFILPSRANSGEIRSELVPDASFIHSRISSVLDLNFPWPQSHSDGEDLSQNIR
jgi:hypothetical protein